MAGASGGQSPGHVPRNVLCTRACRFTNGRLPARVRSPTVVSVPRKPRLQFAGGIFHVTQRATGREVLFLDRLDRLRFDRTLLLTAERHAWEIHDYCQMTNHYHLLVLTREATLARGMQYLNARHVESFNRRHCRRGALVQGRYHDTLVETDEHRLLVRAYLAWNPVDAGLCREPDGWRWGGFGGDGRTAPAPDRLLRRFVADYGRRRRALAARALWDTSGALTPGHAPSRHHAAYASPTAPGHAESGSVERTRCAPESAKRANAASASSVKSASGTTTGDVQSSSR